MTTTTGHPVKVMHLALREVYADADHPRALLVLAALKLQDRTIAPIAGQPSLTDRQQTTALLDALLYVWPGAGWLEAEALRDRLDDLNMRVEVER